jgi:hypothetical protein
VDFVDQLLSELLLSGEDDTVLVVPEPGESLV